MDRKTIINEQIDAPGVIKPNLIQLVLTNHMPPQNLITSAHCLIFFNNQLVMTRLKNRGWEIPGGHVEKDESIIETLKREVKEEIGVKISSPTLLAHEMIHIYAEKPEHYPYPHPISYQVLFVSIAKSFFEIHDPTNQSVERGFFNINNQNDIPWIKDHYELCVEAEKVYQKLLRQCSCEIY